MVDKFNKAPKNEEVVSKINEIIDNLGGGGVAPVWGNITGTLNNQTDLKNALDGKYDASNPNNYTSVTESTVSGWGFTKNTGTVTSVNNVSPVNGNVSLTIPDVQAYTAAEVETLWSSIE